MSVLNATITSLHRQQFQPEDYDHQILLLDKTKSDADPPSSQDADTQSLTPTSTNESSVRTSGEPLLRKRTLRKELARRKYRKWQEDKLRDGTRPRPSIEEAPENDDDLARTNIDREDFAEGEGETHPTPPVGGAGPTPRKALTAPVKLPSATDVLYENQRGTYLCGIPMFSSNSLLNLDPPAWCNSAFKFSLVDTSNAQPPDPSWVWAWPNWTVDMSEDVDEGGWQYSFSFGKFFTWRSSHLWFRSFVRRRRWLRRREQKRPMYGNDEGSSGVHTGHRLNSDYFSIHRGRSHAQDKVTSRGSSLERDSSADESVTIEVDNIAALMHVLKTGKLDREKVDAVSRFLEQGGEDTYYLAEEMPQIMSNLLFQASRRRILDQLQHSYEMASSSEHPSPRKAPSRKATSRSESPSSPKASSPPEHSPSPKASTPEDLSSNDRHLSNLRAAIAAADAQVKRLEYWSDIKHAVQSGEAGGATEEKSGWGPEWQGVDSSGPANREVPEVPTRVESDGEAEKKEGAIRVAEAKEKEPEGLDDEEDKKSEKGKGKE
ncbi:MAG: hypothetical protein M1833_005208 [Piccolia ochrophora]|nr:MAG: hypothetical protein M1833_005208 [Piccolia ochrophora]